MPYKEKHSKREIHLHPDDLVVWERAKARAARDRFPIRAVILNLLEYYAVNGLPKGHEPDIDDPNVPIIECT